MQNPKLFQYAVLFHPTEEEKKVDEKSKVIVELTTVLAVDEKTAAILAGRDIPEEYLDKLDQVEVAIRSF